MNIYYFLNSTPDKKYSEHKHISELLFELGSRYGISEYNNNLKIKILGLNNTPKHIHKELKLNLPYDKKTYLNIYFKKFAHKSLKVPIINGIENGSVLHYFKPHSHKRRKKFNKILEITSLKSISNPELFNGKTDIFHHIRLIQEANIVVTHSDYMAEQIKSKLFADENKIVVIPRGFNIELTPQVSQNYALFFGRIASYKNIDMLIKAFNKVAPKDFSLLIVGDTGSGNKKDLLYLKEIKSLIKTMPEGRIKLLGYLNKEQLTTIISRASFIVEPSIINDFPDTIIEAQSFEKPVIASDIQAHKSACNDTVAYYSYLSQIALEEQIEAVINSPAYYNELSSKSKTNAFKHAWFNVVDKYKTLYESLN